MLTVVTYQIGGDYRSLHRHYYRKSKEDLIRAYQDLQKLLGDEQATRAGMMSYTKDRIADLCCKMHDRIQEDADGT